MNLPTVPWNASWTGEERFEIRPCRWASNHPAIWQPHQPGSGKPMFAKPHSVRQRMSIAKMLCTVCGRPTGADQWWFRLGRFQEGWFMTTEAPVHRVCADYALTVCPHLRGHADDLSPFPSGAKTLRAMVGGSEVATDFGLSITDDRPVVGALKLAWPDRLVRRAPR